MQPQSAGRPPKLRPDYAGTVFPPNIAAPSFVVEEEGSAFVVELHGDRGEPIRAWSKDGGLDFSLHSWRRLLEENRGRSLEIRAFVLDAGGRWTRFEPLHSLVAEEPIDSYLVYRRINVLYNYYTHMQIRERHLESYADRLILDNGSFGRGCMNCHTFLNNGTDRMLIQMRSGKVDHGHGMLLIQDGRVSKINTRTERDPGLAAFSSWHPSGRVVAFSTNTVRQFFHSSRQEVREGIDLNSNLSYYRVDSGLVSSRPVLCRPDRMETWPSWSADGTHLYYCTAPLPWTPEGDRIPDNYADAMYDLMRIPYDVATDTWGDPEVVLSAAEAGMSITLPRESPDGRFLVICMSPHGGFPAMEPEADLYVMDTATRRVRPLPGNSDQTETWHSWSSNSRWLAYATKAGDGLFTRPAFCYVGQDGVVCKPFVLPQRDPRFYDSSIRLYQLPELIREPVPVRGEQIARVIRREQWTGVDIPVTSATPPAETWRPAQ